MRFPKPIITREHGSWVVLSVPMAVAAGTVGAFTIDAFLFVVASLGFFMGYIPLSTLLRGLLEHRHDRDRLLASKVWGTIYLAVGAGAIAPLLVQHYWLLVPLGAAAVLFFFGNFALTQRPQKTIPGDLIAVAGLTMGAPATYYVLTRSLDETAWVLYLLSFLFFGSSVCYVHMKIRVTKGKKSDWSLAEKLAAGRLNLAFHAFVIAVVLVLSFYRLTPATAIIAFVPITIHAVYGTYRLSSRTSFSRLGFALLAHSIVFGILWIIIAHL